MPKRYCNVQGCFDLAVGRKGKCDAHGRKAERERSRDRRGGLKRGGYDEVVQARDERDA